MNKNKSGHVCPYECGQSAVCNGCRNNQGTEMTLKEFEELLGLHITCADCKYFKANAEVDGVKSICKRLDHKTIQFSKNPFASYNCGAGNGTSFCLCKDFELNTIYRQLERHWQPEWKNELLEKYFSNGTICLCLDGNFEVRYEIKRSDFVNNTFKDSDGNIKWIRKQYYKQSRKSPTGYKFINEYPDGYIQEKANAPILWEHVKQR